MPVKQMLGGHYAGNNKSFPDFMQKENKLGVPTKPNRTGKATASDTVFTPIATAKRILDYFNPKGTCLEPSGIAEGKEE